MMPSHNGSTMIQQANSSWSWQRGHFPLTITGSCALSPQCLSPIPYDDERRVPIHTMTSHRESGETTMRQRFAKWVAGGYPTWAYALVFVIGIGPMAAAGPLLSFPFSVAALGPLAKKSYSWAVRKLDDASRQCPPQNPSAQEVHHYHHYDTDGPEAGGPQVRQQEATQQSTPARPAPAPRPRQQSTRTRTAPQASTPQRRSTARTASSLPARTPSGLIIPGGSEDRGIG